MNGIAKKSVLMSLLWRFAERCGAQLVTFVVSIILARILEPSDYGTIALITVFTTVLQVFVDSGLGNALIQKKDADDLDFSTVFFTNVAFCLLLYFSIFLLAPFISSFYGGSEMISYIRVLGLTVLISGIKNVQQAYVAKNMLFKRFFFSTLGGTLVAAAVGITMAYGGFGVWALIAQHVINLLIDTTILWFTVKWRPHRQFSYKRLRELFAFGWKLLVSSLLDTIYNDLRQLIIGRFYSAVDLAYYNQGKKFPTLIITNINTAIDSVLLPAMSNVQDDQGYVKSMTRRSIKISVYIMAPLMVGLCVTAIPLVSMILTDKWLPCVPFLRIFCITYIFYPVNSANLNAIKAMGRSDLFLKLEVVKKIIGIILLLSTMWNGVFAMACSLLITSLISQIINSWPNRKLLNYTYIEQLKDILPSIILALFMGFCVYFVMLLDFSDICTLIIQIILGGIIYITGSAILKFDSFEYIYGIVKSIVNGNLK